jgi:hypothetical protein
VLERSVLHEWERELKRFAVLIALRELDDLGDHTILRRRTLRPP